MGSVSPPELVDYRARLVRAGLASYADQLVALARSSVRLLPEAAAEETLPVGASRIGGRPDMPRGVSWPMDDGRPLSFMAQVNLAGMSGLTNGVLPATGLLSFFYEAVDQPWGFDPADSGGWAVKYWPADAALARCEYPSGLDQSGRFRTMRLAGRREWTFAPWEFSEVARLGLDRDEQFRLADLHGSGDQTTHRLLGHPDPIQGDMQLECQLASHGLNGGDSTSYGDRRRRLVESGAASWRLLLQLDSQDEIDMMWGDVGRLYYWVPEHALQRHDWDDVWLILQCT